MIIIIIIIIKLWHGTLQCQTLMQCSTWPIQPERHAGAAANHSATNENAKQPAVKYPRILSGDHLISWHLAPSSGWTRTRNWKLHDQYHRWQLRDHLPVPATYRLITDGERDVFPTHVHSRIAAVATRYFPFLSNVLVPAALCLLANNNNNNNNNNYDKSILAKGDITQLLWISSVATRFACPHFEGRSRRRGQWWYHSKERWWFPIGSPLWPLRYFWPLGRRVLSNVSESDAQINRGV